MRLSSDPDRTYDEAILLDDDSGEDEDHPVDHVDELVDRFGDRISGCDDLLSVGNKWQERREQMQELMSLDGGKWAIADDIDALDTLPIDLDDLERVLGPAHEARRNGVLLAGQIVGATAPDIGQYDHRETLRRMWIQGFDVPDPDENTVY